MSSLAALSSISQDNDFIGRVRLAVYSVCYDIFDEDEAFPNNPVRRKLAATFIQSHGEQMNRFVYMIVTNPEIQELDPQVQEDIPDALILKTVLIRWNNIAGLSQ